MSPDDVTHADRFRMARHQAGLSVFEFAARAGISEASAFDLESYDDEMLTVYSPADLQRFATVLGVSASELLGIREVGDPLTPVMLAAAIAEFCKVRATTIEEIEEATGWNVVASLGQPDRFLSDYSIDGIQDICRKLSIEWQRFIGGL